MAELKVCCSRGDLILSFEPHSADLGRHTIFLSNHHTHLPTQSYFFLVLFSKLPSLEWEKHQSLGLCLDVNNDPSLRPESHPPRRI